MLWYPFAYVGGEYFAWFVFLYVLRRGWRPGGALRGVPRLVQGRERASRIATLGAGVEVRRCAAALEAYASALPRASKGFLPNLDARRLFLGKCRRDAEAAASRPVLRPLAADLDAIMGRGSHERADFADAPES